MYRYVPYEEIDKNKWNGTIHYSPNGNVYGYHWYLKSVWRQWDAIIEDDYESVLPILPSKMLRHSYDLLPSLGPYSVNALTKIRVNQMLDMAMEYTASGLYPLSYRVDPLHVDDRISDQLCHFSIDTIEPYATLEEAYNADIRGQLAALDTTDVKLTAGIKPEDIVGYVKLDDRYSNALLRIMYNALHRGIGWSSGIIDKKTGKYLSLSFFVASHNKVYELYTASTGDPVYRYFILDLLLRNNSGKPNQLISNSSSPSLALMGFEPSFWPRVVVKDAKTGNVVKWIEKLFKR